MSRGGAAVGRQRALGQRTAVEQPAGAGRTRTYASCRAAAALLLAVAAASCGNGPELPERAGSGTDDLRRSPCACLEIPQAPPEPADLVRYRTAGSAPAFLSTTGRSWLG